MVDYTFRVFSRKDMAAFMRIRVDRRALKELEDTYAKLNRLVLFHK